MKIPTFDATGKPNGHVLTIWNANDQPELRPDQVYLTAIAPHSQKGPHLHMIRRGLFCCIKGNMQIAQRLDVAGHVVYHTEHSGEDYEYALIEVPPGIPACLYNIGDTEALVLNLPSPAWSKDAPDEWPVEDWNP